MNESCDSHPQCGGPTPERPELPPGMPRGCDDVLCDSYYFEDFDSVDAPDGVQVRACAQCGTVHRGNRQVDVGVRDYTGIVIEEVSNLLGAYLNVEEVRQGAEPKQVDENNIRMHCHFSGAVRGTPLEESTIILVNIAREACQRCGRIADGYFASLVQACASDWTLTTEEAEAAIEIAKSYITEREDRDDRNAFIAEVNRVSDDPNIRISIN